MASALIKSLQIQKQSGKDVATSVKVTIAVSFMARLIGLLSRSSLTDNQGLLLLPCGGIHTIGMRFTIDVVFLSVDGRVLGYADNVKPNRLRFAPKGTKQVLEVAEGNRIRTGIHLDDCLLFV